MIVKHFTAGDIIPANAYFYIDEKSRHAFLIDAPGHAADLLDFIKENGLTVEKILITHGHFDHTGALSDLAAALKIPFYIHEEGREYLSDPYKNLSAVFGEPFTVEGASYLKDGDEISLAAAPETKLKVLHTPGHTKDSVVYYDAANGIAFTGDTVFRGSTGRTDFPGGSAAQLADSLHKILTLPDDTVLYSGHTAPTTVKEEKKNYMS